MDRELEALLAVLERFESASIPCMLTGSVAMSIYAEPRMTRDIDLVVELAPGDEQRVMKLFAADYYIPDKAMQSAIVNRGMFNLFDMARLVKIDLVVRKDDEYRRHEFGRRRLHQLGARNVWVVSLEDLILSKLVWAADSHSALQLNDVRKLLASGADEAYLQEWSARLGVQGLLQECRNAGHDS